MLQNFNMSLVLIKTALPSALSHKVTVLSYKVITNSRMISFFFPPLAAFKRNKVLLAKEEKRFGFAKAAAPSRLACHALRQESDL